MFVGFTDGNQDSGNCHGQLFKLFSSKIVRIDLIKVDISNTLLIGLHPPTSAIQNFFKFFVANNFVSS